MDDVSQLEAGSSLQSMDDPTFLAERGRVRDTIEALTEQMQKLDEEFIRRASLAWTGGDAV